MSNAPKKVVKKKIKPYPFDGTLEINGQMTPVEVIFISQKGMIVRLKNQILHVGAYYQAAFEIPVSHEFINVRVRVLKTYAMTVDIKEKAVDRLAELHFQQLTKEHRSRINAFTAAIGQESQ